MHHETFSAGQRGVISSDTAPLRFRVGNFFRSLQGSICGSVEEIEGERRFGTDLWDRPGGGGGITRVIQDGTVFEKAGVNFSEVFGVLPERIARSMGTEEGEFFATGISLVIHPRSPMVPTVHANYRYFELKSGDAWFGGGSDLTPYYPYEEDIVHFHTTLKAACDLHDREYYPQFKQWCDTYFFIPHRRECRGTGGIFFDYLRGNPEHRFAFVRSIAEAFVPSYLPVVHRRMREPWGDAERQWQMIRRGRYVEFNLVYDRGTTFGLETEGRIESVLMSLPPAAAWAYNHRPPEGSREAALLNVLAAPRNWVNG